MLILQILSTLLGIYISALAVKSAVRTFVLPRSAPDAVSGTVFRSIRWLFDLRVRRLTTYEARDQLMAYYAPVSLLSLLHGYPSSTSAIFLSSMDWVSTTGDRHLF